MLRDYIKTRHSYKKATDKQEEKNIIFYIISSDYYTLENKTSNYITDPREQTVFVHELLGT
jgi:hypothetical protein